MGTKTVSPVKEGGQPLSEWNTFKRGSGYSGHTKLWEGTSIPFVKLRRPLREGGGLVEKSKHPGGGGSPQLRPRKDVENT